MSDRHASPHPITTASTRANQTGTWRAFRPAYVQLTSPCREACPAGEDIARWIDLLRAGRYEEAWLILTEDNPFPAIMGRVCPHPCEVSCNRGEHDQPMAINQLERFLGDRALAEGWAFPPPALEQTQPVAVVGGGAAGLSCAYHLRRMGYPVTLFEAGPQVGGHLCQALGEYRLPALVAQAEIQRILDLGITLVTSTRVGVDRTWAELRQTYAAIFVATGAPVILGPDLPGQELPGVLDGLAFLAQVRSGDRQPPGARAVVIGAGLTGAEAARTLRRMGLPVTMVAHQPVDTTNLPPEIAAAWDEGVDLRAPVQVDAILGESRVTGVRLRDRDGAAELAADIVILATGRMADLESLPEEAAVDAQFNLVADPFSGSTNMAGLFAGGDLTGSRHVVTAVGAGKRAAAAIAARLAGRDQAGALESARLGHSPNLAMRAFLRPESYPDHLQVNLKRVVTFPEIEPLYFPVRPRTELPPPGGLLSFADTRPAFAEAEALLEASRCFTCGSCIGCDNCQIFCPDMAIARRADGQGYAINWDYCKGCGACVSECPREALVLEEEVK